MRGEMRATLLWITLLMLVQHVEATQYIGCYMDDDDRAMEVLYNSSYLTVNLCIGTCLTEGFPYAGLQYGSKCRCGSNYDKHGPVDESECDHQCSGDSSSYCGGFYRLSVYRTYSLEFQEHNREAPDSSLLNLLTTRQTTVTPYTPPMPIIAFLEVPANPNRFVAATSDRVLDININGPCKVVLGLQLDRCSYIDNNVNFSNISHLAEANFRLVTIDFGYKFSVLVADRGKHCVTVFDSLNYPSALYYIGVCGAAGMEGNNRDVALEAVRLKNPHYLLVLHSSESVRIVINCENSGVYYIVIVTFTSTSTLANEYTSERRITLVSPFHGVLRSERPAVDVCTIRRRVGDYDEAYSYAGSPDGNDPCVVVEYWNRLFITSSGQLEMIDWPTNSNATSVTRTAVNTDLTSNITADMIAPSTLHRRSVVLYSRNKRTFSLLSMKPWQTAEIRNEKFQLVTSNYRCLGDVINNDISSVESCMYHCMRCNNDCYGVGYNEGKKLCEIVRHQRPIFYANYVGGFKCYWN